MLSGCLKALSDFVGFEKRFGTEQCYASIYQEKTTIKEFPEAAKAALERAFWCWKAVSRFTFTENDSSADLEIGFYKGKHCYGDPFDGPEGDIIAHAARPTCGLLHIDRETSWSFEGVLHDLESVAVHELGHVLGLDHSEDESAVMYKYINPGEIMPELAQDDIDGLFELYSSSSSCG